VIAIVQRTCTGDTRQHAPDQFWLNAAVGQQANLCCSEESSHNSAKQAMGSLDTGTADCARGLLACLYSRHCDLPNIYGAVGCAGSSLLKQVSDSFRRLMVPDQQMQLKGNAFLESQVVQDGEAAALSDVHQHFKHDREQMT